MFKQVDVIKTLEKPTLYGQKWGLQCNHYIDAPDLKEVEVAYWFYPVCPSIFPSVCLSVHNIFLQMPYPKNHLTYEVDIILVHSFLAICIRADKSLARLCQILSHLIC